MTVAHHHILRRGVEAPRVAVASRLDDHGIVTLVKGAVLDQHIACHLDVYAVVVVSFGMDVKVAGYRAVAHIEVDGPERTLANPETVEQDVAAAVEVYEVRTHVVLTLRQLPLLDRDIGRCHGIELFQGLHVRGGTLEPHFPQIHYRGKCARARDGYILAVEGIYQRRIVVALHPLPRCHHGGKIVGGIVREPDHGTLGQVQVDIALEMYRPGHPLAGRNHHAASTCAVTGVDRLGDGLGVVTPGPFAGTVFRDGEIPVGKYELMQVGHRERCLDPDGAVFGPHLGQRTRDKKQQDKKFFHGD